MILKNNEVIQCLVDELGVNLKEMATDREQSRAVFVAGQRKAYLDVLRFIQENDKENEFGLAGDLEDLYPKYMIVDENGYIVDPRKVGQKPAEGKESEQGAAKDDPSAEGEATKQAAAKAESSEQAAHKAPASGKGKSRSAKKRGK